MKNRALLIIIGLILFCCCMIVIAGAAAYPIIRSRSNRVSSGFPNPNPPATFTPESAATHQPPGEPVDGGIGDPTLKGDVWNSILDHERERGCNDVTGTAIDVVQQPDARHIWVEDWAADVCGNDTVFEITFTPDPKGGTNYDIKQK